jgi:hypothetical protein
VIIENQAYLSRSDTIWNLRIEENKMLMIDSPIIQTNGQLDYPTRNDELNRLLCAAVVSKSFRNMLLVNPEIAVASGYQGESFNLSDEDRCWLFSMRPTSLVDFAANMVTFQQKDSQESPVKVPLEPARHLVRVQ